MFVKRAGKNNSGWKLLRKPLKLRRILCPMKPDRSGKDDTFPRRKIERPNSEKDKAFDVEKLH